MTTTRLPKAIESDRILKNKALRAWANSHYIWPYVVIWRLPGGIKIQQGYQDVDQALFWSKSLVKESYEMST